MKTILSLCLFFLFSSSSFARTPMPPSLTADLETARFDAYSPYSEQSFSGGEVHIDRAQKEVSLTLFLNPICPSGSMCIAVINVEKIQLSLVSVKRDRCGVVRYQGKSQSARKKINIVDYTQSYCLNAELRPATFIEYKASYFDESLGYEFETYSTFTAGKLKMRAPRPAH